MKLYVVVDISGRLSSDYDSPQAAQQWMDAANPDSGDCVIWEKTSTPGKIATTALFAVRKDGKWSIL